MIIARLLALGSLALLVSGCAHENKFIGTWKFSSAATRSAPVVLDHLVIDAKTVEIISQNGSASTFTYAITSDTDALINSGLGTKISLIGPNTLHLSDPDSTFARQ
jgi:hypothetical protein